MSYRWVLRVLETGLVRLAFDLDTAVRPSPESCLLTGRVRFNDFTHFKGTTSFPGVIHFRGSKAACLRPTKG